MSDSNDTIQPGSPDFKSVIENLADVYYRANTEGIGIYVSGSVEKLLGYTSDELIGKRIDSLYLNPPDRNDLFQRMTEAGGKLFNNETVLLHKDGNHVWVSANIQFFYDQEGKIAGIEGLVKDITRQKETEKALFNSSKQLRAIFDNMIDLYYRTDNQGNVLLVSPSAKKVMGYDHNEAVGLKLSELYLYPEKRNEFLKELAAGGGQVYGFRAQMVRKDKKIIWVMTNAQYHYDENGKVAGIEGLVRDITELVKTEEKIQEDFQLAKQVQEAIISISDIAKKLNHLFEIDIFYEPLNHMVGGDYYNINADKDGKTMICIADMVGHGTQAALRTMHFDAIYKSIPESNKTGEILLQLNEKLMQYAPGNNFVSAFLANIDKDKIMYSSAGHTWQYLYRSRTGELKKLKAKGSLLGLLDSPKIMTEEETFEKNDILFLFTDGLYDHVDETNKLYGESSLYSSVISILSQNKNAGLKSINSKILDAVNDFRGKIPSMDDIALISVRLK